MTPRTIVTLAILPPLVACTSPDLSEPLEDVVAIVAETQKDLAPEFETRIESERHAAELAAAAAGSHLIRFPPTCIELMSLDLGYDADQCLPQSTLQLDQDPGSYFYARNALQVVESYFTALLTLSNTQGVEELSQKAAALQAAFAAYDGSNLELLDRIGPQIADKTRALPALTSFMAERIRVHALRSTMRAADPVLARILDRLTPTFVQMGDPLGQHRDDTVLAFHTYLQLTQSNTATPEQHVEAANAVRAASQVQQQTEQSSPIRRLALVVDLHSALLAELEAGGASLDELDHLTTQIADIAAALEGEDT